MSKPLDKGKLVERTFDAEGTWLNAIDAIDGGCDPTEVAEALDDLLTSDDWQELREQAPVSGTSTPVPYFSPPAQLCWAIGAVRDQPCTWAPKIQAPDRPETGS